MSDIEKIINDAWENRKNISPTSDKKIIDAVSETINLLDKGKIKVSEKQKDGSYKVNEWIKKGIMLYFRTNGKEIIKGPYNYWFDVQGLPGKTVGWTEDDYKKAGFRAIPNCVIRRGSWVGRNSVIMPNSFINIGARLGENCMLDTGARLGSACSVGDNVHVSAGFGVGGVLEPPQARPTIIEDGVFLGAMGEALEGIIVREGAVLASGCIISQSTKIVDRNTGQITYGEIPPFSVCVPGTLPDKNNPMNPSLNCIVIIKKVDKRVREKTSLNDLLRD